MEQTPSSKHSQNMLSKPNIQISHVFYLTLLLAEKAQEERGEQAVQDSRAQS